MKNRVLSSIALTIVMFLLSCEQKSVSPNASLLGKWNVVNDTQFTGIGATNHQVAYIGKAGDYFDFKSNGKVYIKESAVLDTLSYRLISGTTVSIDSFATTTSRIINLTVHEVTLYSPTEITPGGEFGRTVNLSK